MSGFSTAARADSLGAAAGYSLFSFGDVNGTNGDVEGRAAVGGNATFHTWGINQYTAAGPGLVVGGNLSFNNGEIGSGTVASGTVVVGGSVSGTLNYRNQAGSLTQGVGAAGLPVDFAAAAVELANKSASWGTLAANGTATRYPWGGLFLTGTSAGLNVFTVDAADLNGLNTLQITAPSGSTVLVNVTGSSAITFANAGMSLNGLTEDRVLFNVLGGQAINLAGGFSLEAALLAPTSVVSITRGHIESNTIAASVNATGSGEFHHKLFTGSLPDPDPVPPPANPVPAPPAAVLGAIAVAFGWGWNRRRVS